MVFTRMADGVDWTSYLDSIADVQKRLGVNYSVGNSSDASKWWRLILPHAAFFRALPTDRW